MAFESKNHLFFRPFLQKMASGKQRLIWKLWAKLPLIVQCGGWYRSHLTMNKEEHKLGIQRSLLQKLNSEYLFRKWVQQIKWFIWALLLLVPTESAESPVLLWCAYLLFLKFWERKKKKENNLIFIEFLKEARLCIRYNHIQYCLT